MAWRSGLYAASPSYSSKGSEETKSTTRAASATISALTEVSGGGGGTLTDAIGSIADAFGRSLV
jgi:hypothetical protein